MTARFVDPAVFRTALLQVPRDERDAWLDDLLGITHVLDDGPALPRDCVPYLPCPVDTLLRVVEHGHVRPSDVFVDLGAGPGRAAMFVHLLSGAAAIGIEIQPQLVVAARALAARIETSRVACIEGDAATLAGYIMIGSVFFLYCPFSGTRLAKVLADLETIALTRTIRVCCVDLPLPPCAWLTLEVALEPDLAIYRSTLS